MSELGVGISYGRGIKISMEYNEHPKPHFHVEYAGYEGRYKIADCTPLDKPLFAAQFRFVLAWWRKHQAELYANWERSMQNLPFEKIEGL